MKTNNKPLDDSYIDTFKPVEVKVVGDDVEGAIRAFRTIVTRERIMSILKEHSYYEKPSEKKRRKRRETAQRNRKLLMSKKHGKGDEGTDEQFE